MFNYTNLKYLLLLSALSLNEIHITCAMENDDDLVPTNVGNNGSQAKLSEFSKTAIDTRMRNCLNLIREKGTSTHRALNFNTSLALITDFYEAYKLYAANKNLLEINRVLAFNFTRLATSELYVEWGQFIVSIKDQTMLDHYYKFLLKCIEIENFISSEIDSEHYKHLTKTSVDLLYYNYIMHISTLFLNYGREIKDITLIKNCVRLAKTYFKKIENVPEHKVLAEKAAKGIEDLALSFQQKPINLKVGPRGKALVARNESEKRIERHTAILQGQEEIGLYNPRGNFVLIINLMQKATAEWTLSKDIDAHLVFQRQANKEIQQLENVIAQKLQLNADSNIWASEDYDKIYKELSTFVEISELKSSLPSFMLICLNLGDFKRGEPLLKAYAKLLGGSGDSYESVPNVLKQSFVLLKYLQGQPEVWDMHEQRLEREREKKRQARRKHKEDKVISEVSRIANERTQKNARDQGQTEQSKPQKRLTSSVPAVSTSPQLSLPEEQGQHNHKAESKRRAQEALDKIDLKKQKKDAKNHNAVESSVLEASSATPSMAPASISSQDEMIASVSSPTRKLYRNLYSLAPKLTPEDAMKLLAGFRLTVNKAAGKGSHAKCTFSSGETITTDQGIVVGSFPDLAEMMAIIPKWDGKDIPYYMIANLRYILEKIGIKPDSF